MLHGLSGIDPNIRSYISNLANGYTSRELQLNAGFKKSDFFDLPTTPSSTSTLYSENPVNDKNNHYSPAARSSGTVREKGDMSQRERELIEKINKKPGNPTNTSIGDLKNPKSKLNTSSGKNNTTTSNDFWGFNGSKNPLDWGGGTQIIGTALLAAGAYGLFKLYKKYRDNKKSDQEFLQDHPEAKQYLDKAQ